MGFRHWSQLLTVLALASTGYAEAPTGGAAALGARPEATTRSFGPDSATAKTLTVKDAKRVVASAGELLSLPHLSQLSVEAAHELATTRDPSRVLSYSACVPYTEEVKQTYVISVPYTEDKEREDGSTVTINKCRREQRTRTVNITRCRRETLTRLCPAVLQLDGLTSPTAEILEELAKHEGHLRLNGLKRLEIEQAQKLAAHTSGTLALNGLDSLDEDVANALASHGGPLSLNAITSLSAETARALSANKHGLSLDGIAVLTDEIAAELAMHEGLLSLMGLTLASEKALQLLRAKQAALPNEVLLEQKKGSQ